MPITKAKKEQILKELKEKAARQKATVLVGITGLKVKDITELRKRIKSLGGEMKVVKKTLAQLALKENKLEFDKSAYKTEVAFVFGYEDEVAPAKTVYQFSKENDKAKILGGFLGTEFKNENEMVFLAQLPTKEELLAKFVGSVSNPLFGLVNVFQGNIKGLIVALGAVKDKAATN